MVELWLKSNITNEWVSLDIPTDLAVSVNKSFEEVEDFSTIKSTFTKTFNLPQSDTNNRFFRSCFLVNSSNFGSSIVVPAVIKYGGADVFNGELRLNKINNEELGGNYEVFLTESLPDLSNTLQNIRLIDLDYSDISHDLNYDNIVGTWDYTGGTYDNYSGLTGRVLYPLAHYGYEDTQYRGEFNLGPSGFTNFGGALTTAQFAPWLNVKYLFDKAFERANFTYTSDFLNSDYFAGIFTIAKANDTMGGKIAADSPENANVFIVESRTPFTDIGWNPQRTNLNTTYAERFRLTDELNDPLNIFTPSIFVVPFLQNHYFTPAVDGVYKFKVSFRARLQNAFLATYLNIAIKDVDNGTIYAQRQGLIIFNSANPTTYTDLYMNATLPAGRRVALWYSVQSGGGDPYADIVFEYQKWELWTSPIIALSDLLLIQDNLPAEINCLEFVKGIVNHFNLVVIPDGERNFLIEPWDDYFSSGRVFDWSDKLDESSTQSLSPTTELNKEYIFEFAEADDKFSKINVDTRNQRFGTKRFISTLPFHTGILRQESIFEPLPISTFDDETESNILIPHLYEYTAPTNEVAEQFEPIASGLRLGFYNGKLDSKITGTTTNWYLLSGATPTAHNTYPAISHLSSYEYSASTFSDLNYKNQYDYWQVHNNSYVGYTSRDVFNDFWSGRLNSIYEEDTKFFEGKFVLTPEDINNIQFNDKVYFKDAYWRLYNIKDGDITSESLVDCTFLKIPYDLYPTDLIAPTYQQSEPIIPPTYTATTGVNVFVNNDITKLCDETATLYGYYSNCGILDNGCVMFFDSGATTTLDEGTFLKQAGTNTIYQVQENGIINSIQICN